MKISTIIWIIVVIVVAVGAWWYMGMPLSPQLAAPASAPTHEDEPNVLPGTTTPSSSEEPSSVPLTTTVSYNADGFSPQQVTIKKGGTVVWNNMGSGNMWIATAQHPSHTTYAGTALKDHCDDSVDISFDQCKNGAAYSFTFDKVGTWSYHNHSNSSHFGRVIVVE